MEFPPKWKLAARDWGNKKERMKDAKGGFIVGFLVWNDETYEGEVMLSPAILKADWLTKADMLSDFNGLLSREYEAALPSSSEDPE